MPAMTARVRSMPATRARSAGFTLIELLVVTAIIAILVAIAIPGLLNALDRSRQATTTVLMRAYGVAIGTYYTDNDDFPRADSIESLVPMLKVYDDHLRATDAWAHVLSYRSDGEHYTLESFGKDGVDGDDITPSRRYAFMLDLVFCDGAFAAGVE